MAKTERSLIEERLRSGLRGLFSQSAPFRESLLAVLERIRLRGWSAALFGGALRDLAAGPAVVPPRDFDIVVAGVSLPDLETAFAGEVRRLTRYGGLHLLVGGVRFDLWPLEQTWGFRECPGREPTFTELPRTTFLNVEGVAVEMTGPGAGTIHDGGFFEAVLSRTLEINLEPNPSPLQCVVRSLVTAARLEFSLGPRLTRYLATHAARLSPREIVEAGLGHYGQHPWDAGTLRAWLESLREWGETKGQAAVDPASLDLSCARPSDTSEP